jgi:transposase
MTTLAAELGTLRRFQHPKQLMGYIGLGPSEHSSGKAILCGRIAKSGIPHVRRVLIEAVWSYRHAPHLTDATWRESK